MLFQGPNERRVFGWISDYDGCSFYRVRQPLDVLGTRQISGEDVFWHTDSGLQSPPEWFEYDVIVGQKVCKADDVDSSPAHQWVVMCKDYDVLSVYEIDDDLFNLDPTNPAYEFFNDPATKNNVKHCISVADIVTVTNEPLAEVIRQYNKNVVVIPNYVDESLLHVQRPHNGDAVVIGWAGSRTHKEDFAFMGNGLKRTMERNENTRFMTIGAPYGDNLPNGRVRRLPWIKATQRLYRSMAGFDIGIAPLKPTVFNQSKSYIKALEYAALGIPCVASDTGPYPEFIKHGETGFLVKRDNEWEKYLSLLVKDQELRIKMGEAAREHARNFTIQGNIWLFHKTYLG